MYKFLSNKIESRLLSWLPDYLNGNLHPLQEHMLEMQLQRSPQLQHMLKCTQQLQLAVQQQPFLSPHPDVLQRTLGQIRDSTVQDLPSQALSKKTWGFGMALACLAFVLLWNLIPPGTILKWSVEGKNPATFQVYRAPAETLQVSERNPFTLIQELPAIPTSRTYTYTDLHLFSWEPYLYRVDVLDQDGQLATSQTILSTPFDALPGQLAVTSILLIVSYGVWLWFKQGYVLHLRQQRFGLQ